MSFDFTTDVDGTHHIRDDYHAGRCIVETDDPRVSGVRSSTSNIDLWGNANAGSWALVQWGTPRLENDGGPGMASLWASAPSPAVATSS